MLTISMDDEFVEKIDKADDKLWDVATSFNDAYKMNLNFEEIDHTALSIRMREAVLETLSSFVEKTRDGRIVDEKLER